jgi:uridine kinase
MEIADTVKNDRKIRAIFVSGPTASGKTTFSHKLSSFLNEGGISSVTVSLDDYYFFQKYEFDEYGRPNFERLEILDTKLMLEQIEELLKGNPVKIPSFDFIIKDRVPDKSREIVLPLNGVVLIEGLHGMSKSISGALPKHEWLGVFIMPYATLSEDARLLEMRDIRILRRISRDALHRGASALATIDYWPMLDREEEVYFHEYLANADVYINSILPYEFYCVAPFAHKLIAKAIMDYDKKIKIDSNLTKHRGLAQPELAVTEAKRLLFATGRIPQINMELVPESSILNEFIR